MKKYCAFQGGTHYIDKIGEIINESEHYYIINIVEGYYKGGNRIWSIEKEKVKLFDSPKLASKWIEDQDFYYNNNYQNGLSPETKKQIRL